MSVLIRDMDLPDTCDECRLNSGLFCDAMPHEWAEFTLKDERPEWCPLEECEVVE